MLLTRPAGTYHRRSGGELGCAEEFGLDGLEADFEPHALLDLEVDAAVDVAILREMRGASSLSIFALRVWSSVAIALRMNLVSPVIAQL
jgi:hypothetical protein